MESGVFMIENSLLSVLTHRLQEKNSPQVILGEKIVCLG